MALPPLPPFPPVNVRKDIAAEDWKAGLAAWDALIELYLRSSEAGFLKSITEVDSIHTFLSTYIHEHASSSSTPLQASQSHPLHRNVFLLIHRVLSTSTSMREPLRDWTFLADLAIVYSRAQSLRLLLQGLWKRRKDDLEPGFLGLKERLLAHMDGPRKTASDEDLALLLKRLTPLLQISPDIASLFMVGSDFLDGMVNAYQRSPQSSKKLLVRVTYLCLLSLIKTEKPNISLLIDHLFSLRTSSHSSQDDRKGADSLAVGLVSTTPFLSQVRDRLQGANATRAEVALSSLEATATSLGLHYQKPIRRKAGKGKAPTHGEATNEYGHGDFGEIHVHRMSLVTQVQDIFPDLGAGFVFKLLDEYHDDVEQVTAHLLEESLPPHLRNADRSETL